MILIADSGGSKTDWRLIQGNQIHQFVTSGFNARTDDFHRLMDTIPDEINLKEVAEFHFYLAGLNDSNKNNLKEQLKSIFENAHLHLHPDTLGVARSLYGNESGWVGILGTGSAAVYYDGQQIAKRKPSLGYILGDEGSGVDLGRRFVKGFFRGELSDSLRQQLASQFPKLTEETLLVKLYEEDEGREYLSHFVPYLADHQTNAEMHQIIQSAFESYFDAFFTSERIETIAFSGSVAHYLSNVLDKGARRKGIGIKRIIQSPIAGLTLYHQNHG